MLWRVNWNRRYWQNLKNGHWMQKKAILISCKNWRKDLKKELLISWRRTRTCGNNATIKQLNLSHNKSKIKSITMNMKISVISSRISNKSNKDTTRKRKMEILSKNGNISIKSQNIFTGWLEKQSLQKSIKIFIMKKWWCSKDCKDRKKNFRISKDC